MNFLQLDLEISITLVLFPAAVLHVERFCIFLSNHSHACGLSAVRNTCCFSKLRILIVVVSKRVLLSAEI